MSIPTGTNTTDPCLSPESCRSFYLDMTFFFYLMENTKKLLMFQKLWYMATAFFSNSIKFTAPALQCYRPSHSSASQCQDADECSLVPSKSRTPSDAAGQLVLLLPCCAKVLRTLLCWWHEEGYLSCLAWSLVRQEGDG